MIELEITTYDQAVKMKQLGFEGSKDCGYNCEGVYGNRTGQDGEIIWFHPKNSDPYPQYDFSYDIELIPSPPLALACKWLRDTFLLNIFVHPYPSQNGELYIGYDFEVIDAKTQCRISTDNDEFISSRYENAESSAIDFTLNYLIKQKAIFSRRQARKPSDKFYFGEHHETSMKSSPIHYDFVFHDLICKYIPILLAINGKYS